VRKRASQSPSTFTPTHLYSWKEIGMLVNLRGSLVLLPLLALFACPASAAVDARAKVGETWGSVPLQFEENRAGESVRFLAHGPGYSVHLTSTDAALVLAKPGVRTNDEPSEAVTLRMTVVGARSTAAVAGSSSVRPSRRST